MQNPPISRLNVPLEELLLAARRQRSQVLRAMFTRAARAVALLFAGHRKQATGSTAKSLHG